MKRHTELSANIVAFCRYLRNNGLSLGSLEQADALKALELLPFQQPEDFRLILRSVLTKSQAEQKLFDALYQDYWEQLARALNSSIKQETDEASQKSGRHPPLKKDPPSSFQSLKSWLYGNNATEEQQMAAYSAAEMLIHKDFSSFGEDELQEVMELIQRLAKSLASRYNRRYQRHKSAVNFDLRRTMRLNMRRGGDIIELAYRRRRIRRLKIVMLCDVSKSMDLYSRFLIQFIYAFQNIYRRIETFVFSTSLHRITEQLKSGTFSDSLDQISQAVPNWSGGTKIGTSLKQFLEVYGRKLLDDRTIVLIMSDGWDTGDIEILAESMSKIHLQTGRVIWLNPLAGSPAYQPTVRGMQAALPYVDVFAPAHNIESLRAVLGNLNTLKKRPAIRLLGSFSKRLNQ